MSLYDATERELEGLGTLPPSLREALLLAARALDGKPSAMMLAEFRATWELIRQIQPPKPEADGIDELNDRRSRRRTG